MKIQKVLFRYKNINCDQTLTLAINEEQNNHTKKMHTAHHV